jgi:hypothetical protein
VEPFEFLGVVGGGGTGTPLQILLSLAAAFTFSLIIGFTYKKTHTGPLYAQGYVHTLILVGLVSSVVLQIVGENIAAAFAIFGAFSIIRFRNAVPETRDVGFIFLSMVIGLASGAGQFALALSATTVICLTMFSLWRLDLFAPDLPNHILRVRVTNDIDFSTAFQPSFEALLERSMLQRVESVQGGMLTEVTYGIRLKPGVSAHALISALQAITGYNRVLLIGEGPEILA